MHAINTESQFEYRSLLGSGQIKLCERHVKIAFRRGRDRVAYRMEYAEFQDGVVRRLVRTSFVWWFFVLGGTVAALMAVCDLWLSRGNLFGMLLLGSAAIAWWALASRCRTVTWYYMRCNDVHGTPLLFPCPWSEINQCERVLGEIRARITESASSK